MEKSLSPAYYLKLKNIILFLNQDLLILFSNGHIDKVVSTLPNVVKIDIENDNVVLTLSNIVQFNVEKFNVVSALFNTVNFNVDVQHNIASILIWHCVTSRFDIVWRQAKNNVEPTLKCLLCRCLLCFHVTLSWLPSDSFPFRIYVSNQTTIFCSTNQEDKEKSSLD